MSANCVRCGQKPCDINRPKTLLCSECASGDWDAKCEAWMAQHESLRRFIDTFGAFCGAPRDVFIGQTVAMLHGVLRESLSMMKEHEGATAGALLEALVDNFEEDFLLALRFAYYVRAKPFVPDPRYDEAEREYVNRGEIEDTPLMNPGSDKEEDYPARVRALYNYLGLARLDQSTGKAPSAALGADSSPVKAPAKGKTPKAAPDTLF